MPRYAYQKPRARTYGYNIDYYKNYYKPMSHYIEQEKKDPETKPGPQTLAEVSFKMPHPYRLPVEDIVVPPHESSIWPEHVPHFHLVSSYDLMVGFLGIDRKRV